MIAQGLRLLQLQSERFADLRREIGIGIGALAPGGDDERNKFPPKRKRPSTFSTRYPQFEQLPRPLPSPSPADVFRWNVEGRNLGKAAVLHMLDYRLEHRISKTQ